MFQVLADAVRQASCWHCDAASDIWHRSCSAYFEGQCQRQRQQLSTNPVFNNSKIFKTCSKNGERVDRGFEVTLDGTLWLEGGEARLFSLSHVYVAHCRDCRLAVLRINPCKNCLRCFCALRSCVFRFCRSVWDI